MTKTQSALSPRHPKFTYEIHLQSWKPSEAHLPPSHSEVFGGANDIHMAWVFALETLRTAVNSDRAHYRVQVWRRAGRGVPEKMVYTLTRAELDSNPHQNRPSRLDRDGVRATVGALG